MRRAPAGSNLENIGNRVHPRLDNAAPFSKEWCKELLCQVSRQLQVSRGRSRQEKLPPSIVSSCSSEGFS